MDPHIQILGAVVHHPWSVGTNLLLAFECSFLGGLTWRGDAPQSRLRGWFFCALAIGAFFGALKHGFPGMPGHDAIRFFSNVGLGVAVTFVQVAAIRMRAPSGGLARWLERLALLQCLIFLGFSFRTQEFVVPGLQLAIGMTPVLLAAGWSAMGGSRPDLWIATGLIVALAAGGVYALELGFNPWFNHKDVAHVLLAGTVAFLYRGFHLQEEPPVSERAAWSLPSPPRSYGPSR